MRTRYGGRLALAALLLSSCSSGDDTAREASPTPTPTPAVSTTPTAPPSATQATRPSPSASASPTPRRTASPTPSPTPRRTSARQPSPTPKPSPPSSPSRPGTTHGVRAIAGDRFVPSSVTLRIGDKVRVTHEDPTPDVPHDFVIRALNVDSGPMSQGDAFSYTFRRTGRFTFVCSYHDDLGMRGTVTVQP